MGQKHTSLIDTAKAMGLSILFLSAFMVVGFLVGVAVNSEFEDGTPKELPCRCITTELVID